MCSKTIEESNRRDETESLGSSLDLLLLISLIPILNLCLEAICTDWLSFS